MNHSWFKGLTKRKMADLERRAAMADRLLSKEAQRPFVDAFLTAIGTVLASTPYDKWPPFVRDSYDHAAKLYPSGAREYRNNLPK